MEKTTMFLATIAFVGTAAFFSYMIYRILITI